MEAKKTPEANLENKRKYFLQFGLVVSLFIVLAAFSMNSKVKPVETLGTISSTPVSEEVVYIPRTEPPKIVPPPPIIFDKLLITDNPTEIEEPIFQSTEIREGEIVDATPRIAPEKTENSIEKILDYADQMPEFPGGPQALLLWIKNQIKYPSLAVENGIQGIVYVQFAVDRDGSVSNVHVARGVYPSLDEEALRVIKELPKWKPGMQKGQLVRVAYTVPINFKLQTGL